MKAAILRAPWEWALAAIFLVSIAAAALESLTADETPVLILSSPVTAAPKHAAGGGQGHDQKGKDRAQNG